MILYRVAVTVDPGHLQRAHRLFAELVDASRQVPGVIDFDILQDPADPHRFVSIEVYADEDAVERQGKLPQLQAVMDAFQTLLIIGPKGTRFVVLASEPWP
ncbi:putative quinol monooxygenase [Nonomuraea gerenzanensis]|uniref:putative quinol monooxygenase n=1 Tax=Nonomuraea gerenzanensis TaxID=93944 RepID=UPI001CD91A79|nr:putative quinol monooxygenase [Nonomuraea gerenzanensis]UBU16692.1 antibiotic biosynthesis monooxygenase [Nonomuraea gerenzanensis]